MFWSILTLPCVHFVNQVAKRYTLQCPLHVVLMVPSYKSCAEVREAGEGSLRQQHLKVRPRPLASLCDWHFLNLAIGWDVRHLLLHLWGRQFVTSREANLIIFLAAYSFSDSSLKKKKNFIKVWLTYKTLYIFNEIDLISLVNIHGHQHNLCPYIPVTSKGVLSYSYYYYHC